MLSYSKNVRILFSALVIVGALDVACGQSAEATPSPQPSPRPRVDKNAIVDPVFASADLARLLVKGYQPPLTLQRALKIAEHYLRTMRIPVSSYFLLEARLIEYGGDQTPRELRWFFRWGLSKRPPVEITVSMSGKPSRSPSM